MRNLLLLAIVCVSLIFAVKDDRNDSDYELQRKKCTDVLQDKHDDPERWLPAHATEQAALCTDEKAPLVANKAEAKDHKFVNVDRDNDNTTQCCFKSSDVCGKEQKFLYKSNRFHLCRNDAECTAHNGECNMASQVCCEKKSLPETCPHTVKPPTDKCDADAKGCLRQAKFETACMYIDQGKTKEYCCGFDNDYKCPGGAHPVTEAHQVKQKDCNTDFSYLYKHDKFNHDVCCPYLVPESLSTSEHYHSFKNKAESDKLKECTTHVDCGSDEYFCDVAHMKFGENINDHREIMPEKKFCWKMPACAGVVTKKADTGVLTCNVDSDCGDEEFCDTMGTPNAFVFPKGDKTKKTAQFCCKLKCPSSPPTMQYSSIDPVIELEARNLTAHPEDKFSTIACDTDCGHTSEEKTSAIGVCLKDIKDQFGVVVPGHPGRCCNYESKATQCMVGTPSKDRTKNRFVTCEDETPCAELGAICDKKARMCCEGADTEMCSDQSTMRTFQEDCNATSPCGNENMKCDHGKCCPLVSDGAVTQFVITGRPCTPHSNQCGFVDKFCDTETSKCAHFGKANKMTADGKYRKTNTPCSESNPCKKLGDRRYVCIYATAGGDGECWLYPLDNPASRDFGHADPVIVTCAIILAVMGVIFGLMAVLFFLKYRSRHLFDRKKSKPAKKEKGKGNDSETESKSTKM